MPAVRFLPLLIVAIALLLGGCATGAKTQNMVSYDLGGNQKPYDEALKNGITIGHVGGGKSTNPLWLSKVSDQEFSGALTASLQAHGLYSPTGQYQLTVNLLKVKQPFMGSGISMSVTSTVQYQLVDPDNENILFDNNF